MKILIVGGAGYVGSIVRDGLEAQHDCWYYDLKPVVGRESRTILADVCDAQQIQRAVVSMQAIVYMAMGVTSLTTSPTGHREDVHELNFAFSVNTGGWLGFVTAGLLAGVRRFVYTSSLSVFANEMPDYQLTEDHPPSAWHPYGMSKRCGEFVCEEASKRQPDATFLTLRVMAPRNRENFAARQRYKPDREPPHLGPEDTTRLYLASIACERPGYHIIHATGDVKEQWYRHRNARDLLGWEARGN